MAVSCALIEEPSEPKTSPNSRYTNAAANISAPNNQTRPCLHRPVLKSPRSVLSVVPGSPRNPAVGVACLLTAFPRPVDVRMSNESRGSLDESPALFVLFAGLPRGGILPEAVALHRSASLLLNGLHG